MKKLGKVGTNVLATTINGVTGEDNICEMWRDHYSKLLNSNKDETHKTYVEKAVKDLSKSCKFDKLSYIDIFEAIKDLKTGKCAGIDNLQSEHFKYADISLSCLLCMIINSMLFHGYVPPMLMETMIVPIIKDKKGSSY